MVTCGGPPRLQRRAVALHESKLVSWELREGDLLLRLDGYVHASLGVPGQDQGTAWSQALELRLRDAQLLEQPTEPPPIWISGGGLEIAGQPLAFLPVPHDERAAVLLRLESAAGSFRASGSGLALTALGEARFVERISARR